MLSRNLTQLLFVSLALILTGVSTAAELKISIDNAISDAAPAGNTEVANGNRKGQTFRAEEPIHLTEIALRIADVTEAKDLSLSVFSTVKEMPAGDTLFTARGMLPKGLDAGQSLRIELVDPVHLEPGKYAIVFETEKSQLRFALSRDRYLDGRLVRQRNNDAWMFGAGKGSDLVFAIPGSGIRFTAAKASGPGWKSVVSKTKAMRQRDVTLNRAVSTNVTPLCERLPTRPNIVVCMVDDLGWNQISVPQSTMGTQRPEYATPNLERLANQGLSFTHAYAQPNCAPTRAAMLSGQYPARIHNDVYVVSNLNRNGGGGISKEDARFKGPQQTEDVAVDAITVAESLKMNGYATGHVGKYHVGGHDGPETLPENVGFDINIGGHTQGHQPTCFASSGANQSDGESTNAEGWGFKRLGRGDFDRFAEPYTQSYVEKHGFPDSLVGRPKHVSDALGDAMEETISKLNASGNPFYLQVHPYAVHGPVRARPDLKAAGGSELAGFIASIDLNIGRLLKALDDPNGDGDSSDSIAANTLVLFTSDNGGTHGDNLPLRGVKGMFTEGGVRVPLIAYWPGVIPPGTVTDSMVHSVDYYPTYLELAGKQWTPPANTHPLDGESFASILRKPDVDKSRGPIFYLFPGYMDVRAQPCVVAIDEVDGERFKLLYFYEADAWELYNLTDDIGEDANLLETKTEVASDLSKKIRRWLEKQHPTWKPKYPLLKANGKPAGPPPVL